MTLHEGLVDDKIEWSISGECRLRSDCIYVQTDLTLPLRKINVESRPREWELIQKWIISEVKTWLVPFNQIISSIWPPWRLSKTLWRKDKTLVSSMCPFRTNVFYPMKNKFHCLSDSHLFCRLQMLAVWSCLNCCRLSITNIFIHIFQLHTTSIEFFLGQRNVYIQVVKYVERWVLILPP